MTFQVSTDSNLRLLTRVADLAILEGKNVKERGSPSLFYSTLSDGPSGLFMSEKRMWLFIGLNYDSGRMKSLSSSVVMDLPIFFMG